MVPKSESISTVIPTHIESVLIRLSFVVIHVQSGTLVSMFQGEWYILHV